MRYFFLPPVKLSKCHLGTDYMAAYDKIDRVLLFGKLF